MTVLRGQYYQSKIFPDEFWFVSRIFSPTKILMFIQPGSYQIYQTTAQIEANYTLLDFLPINRLEGHSVAQVTATVAHCLTGDFLSARVGAHQTFRAKATAPTYLRGRLVSHTMVQGVLINPLILGGNLAAQGRVVQAQADQG